MNQANEPQSLIASVQKRPGMYIGDPRSRHGVVNLVNELLANIAVLFLVGKASAIPVSDLVSTTSLFKPATFHHAVLT